MKKTIATSIVTLFALLAMQVQMFAADASFSNGTTIFFCMNDGYGHDWTTDNAAFVINFYVDGVYKDHVQATQIGSSKYYYAQVPTPADGATGIQILRKDPSNIWGGDWNYSGTQLISARTSNSQNCLSVTGFNDCVLYWMTYNPMEIISSWTSWETTDVTPVENMMNTYSIRYPRIPAGNHQIALHHKDNNTWYKYANTTLSGNITTSDGGSPDNNIAFTLANESSLTITVTYDATGVSAQLNADLPLTEYDHYIPAANMPATTWETNANGDVVITISDAPGATNATFRNGGFEGGMGAWFVLSGDDFSTSEPASNYFTSTGGATGTLVFSLVKKADVTLPYPCHIRFQTSAFSWYCDENNHAYRQPCVFEYTYGALSHPFYAPTNVAVDVNGAITFDAIPYNYDAAEDTYEALIYKDGTLIKSQEVGSGDVLNFIPVSTGTYQVRVVAISGNYASEMSTAYDWTVEAGHIYGQSVYCDWAWNTTEHEGWPVHLTWATETNGNITITLTANGDEGDGITAFRGGGMNIDNFKVNGVNASTYFSKTWTDNILTLSLLDPANKPTYGLTISYNGYVEYRTGTHGNAWPTLNISDYIYGSRCSATDRVDPTISAFSCTSTTTNTATFHVEADDVDDEGGVQPLTYTISGNNDFSEQNVIPDASGNFVVSGLIPNETYEFTITATDPSGNATSRSADVVLQFDSSYNLALNKPATAGRISGNAAGYEQDKANDGNYTNRWATGAHSGTEDDWWTVDLKYEFELNQIRIYWPNDNAQSYCLQASFDGVNWWDFYYTDQPYTSGSGDPKGNAENILDLSVKTRYIRVKVLSKTADYEITIHEFEAYGVGYSNSTDNTKPVVTATVASTTSNSGTINVSVTDAEDGTLSNPLYFITCTELGYSQKPMFATDGQLTINNIPENWGNCYVYIQAADLSGNMSEPALVSLEMPFNSGYNLALNKPVYVAPNHAGTGNINHTNGQISKSNNGDYMDWWGSADNNNTPDNTKDWWVVDLGRNYDLTTVKIYWELAHPYNYMLQARIEEPTIEDLADDSKWYTFYRDQNAQITNWGIKGEGAQGATVYDAPISARYLRVKAFDGYNGLMYGIAMYEFEAYGTGSSFLADLPVMTYITADYVYHDAAALYMAAEVEIGHELAYEITFVSSNDPEHSAILPAGGPEQSIGSIFEVNDLHSASGQSWFYNLKPLTTYTFKVRVHDLTDDIYSANYQTLTFTTPANLYLEIYNNTHLPAVHPGTNDPHVHHFEAGSVDGVAMLRLNLTAGTYYYKLRNEDASQYTLGSDRMLVLTKDSTVTFYAKNTDFFASTADHIYITGVALGEDNNDGTNKAVMNASRELYRDGAFDKRYWRGDVTTGQYRLSKLPSAAATPEPNDLSGVCAALVDMAPQSRLVFDYPSLTWTWYADANEACVSAPTSNSTFEIYPNLDGSNLVVRYMQKEVENLKGQVRIYDTNTHFTLYPSSPVNADGDVVVINVPFTEIPDYAPDGLAKLGFNASWDGGITDVVEGKVYEFGRGCAEEMDGAPILHIYHYNHPEALKAVNPGRTTYPGGYCFARIAYHKYYITDQWDVLYLPFDLEADGATVYDSDDDAYYAIYPQPTTGAAADYWLRRFSASTATQENFIATWTPAAGTSTTYVPEKCVPYNIKFPSSYGNYYGINEIVYFGQAGQTIATTQGVIYPLNTGNDVYALHGNQTLTNVVLPLAYQLTDDGKYFEYNYGSGLLRPLEVYAYSSEGTMKTHRRIGAEESDQDIDTPTDVEQHSATGQWQPGRIYTITGMYLGAYTTEEEMTAIEQHLPDGVYIYTTTTGAEKIYLASEKKGGVR